MSSIRFGSFLGLALAILLVLSFGLCDETTEISVTGINDTKTGSRNGTGALGWNNQEDPFDNPFFNKRTEPPITKDPAPPTNDKDKSTDNFDKFFWPFLYVVIALIIIGAIGTAICFIAGIGPFAGGRMRECCRPNYRRRGPFDDHW